MHRFLLVLVFLFSSLYSNEKVLSNLGGLPSGVINSTVNVTTGSYCETHQDITVPGIENLSFQRTLGYPIHKEPRSKKQKGKQIIEGWTSNHFGYFYSLTPPMGEGTTTVLYSGPHAMQIPFENGYAGGSRIPNYCYTHGLTNTGQGGIGGKTNHHNDRLKIDYDKNSVKLTIGSGEIREFEKRKHTYNHYLKKIHQPNNLFTCYEYDKNYRLSKIIAHNGREAVLSQLEITYPTKEKMKKNYHIDVHSSSGQHVRYKIFKASPHTMGKLTDVESTCSPDVHYDYTTYKKYTESTVAKRSFPEGRVLETSYYKKGMNQVGGQNLTLKKDDFRIDRVSHQLAPVGHDETPITCYRYVYFDFKGSRVQEGRGRTEVYDALDNLTKYDYTFNCINEINRYAGKPSNYILHSTEKFLWGKPNTHNHGNLTGHLICHPGGTINTCKAFIYDDRGNAIEEHLYGNLTGDNTVPITIKDHFIEDTGADKYCKRYTYSNDGYNNVTSEDDGRKRITYEYYPNSSLLKSQFIGDHQKNHSRQFFFYNVNAVLIKTIVDDGSSTDCNDLTSVTERHTTEFIQNAGGPVGYPSEVISKYLDMTTGQDVTLTTTAYTYTREAWITSTTVYDGNGELLSSTSQDYDSMGNVILEVDACGNVTEREYDANCNLIHEQGPRQDYYRKFGYDWSNRLVYDKMVFTDGKQLTQSNTYDYCGNKTSETDIYGNTTHYTFDEFGRATQATLPDGSIASKQTYDLLGYIISKTDGNGNLYTITNTSRGQPTHVTHADGTSSHYKYTLDGLLHEEVSKEKITTQYAHDYMGRIIKKERYSSEGQFLDTHTYEYNAFHLIRETNSSGTVTTNTYDHAGMMIKRTTNDHVTTFSYDDLGRLIKTVSRVSDDDAIVTKKTYDCLNRVVSAIRTDLQGNIQSQVDTEYDEDGNPIAISQYGKAGVSRHIKEYNVYGEVIKEIDALGNTSYVHIDYDYINDQGYRVGYKKMADPLGNKTIVIKDVRGRNSQTIKEDAFGKRLHHNIMTYDGNDCPIESIEEVHLDGQPTRTVINKCEYNANSQVIKKIEAYGADIQKETLFRYNNLGKKIAIVKPDGVEITYTYDAKGLLHQVMSSDGSIHYRYTYDLLDNPILVEDLVHQTQTSRIYNSDSQVVHETLANGHSVATEYDNIGRFHKILHPDGVSVEYTYQGDQLKKITSFNSDDTEKFTHRYVAYDQRGLLLETQLPGKCGSCIYDYDLLGRVRHVETKHWRENIAGFDEAGNLLCKEIEDEFGNTKDQYQYDALHQLKQESGSVQHDYQSDSLNNRTCKDGVSHEINALNQLTNDGGNQYSYDQNGNITKIVGPFETTKLSYDAFDRLVSVSKEGIVTTYQYDDKHRRIAKNNETYIYHGRHEIGAVNDSGTIYQRRYLGNGLGAEIGAAVAIEIDDHLYVPIHDHNGSVACIISTETQEVAECYRYSAFGEEGSDQKESENPWRFSSKRYDPESGFLFFGRRYYMPKVGRWLTADPLGDHDGVNLYAYVSNNPLTHIDAYGLYRSYAADYNASAVFGNYSRRPSYDRRATAPQQVGYNKTLVDNRDTSLENDKYLQFANERFKKLKITRIGEKPCALGVMQVYNSGILTETKECFASSKPISDSSGGCFVYAICNPTEGKMRDAASISKHMNRIDTEAVKELRDFFNFAITELKKEHPQPKLYIHSHSRGGMETDCAGIKMTKANKDCLHVRTYGSATIIPSGRYGSIINYVNDLDLVPQHMDSYGYTHYKQDIVMTGFSTGNRFEIEANHTIWSKGYQDSIDKSIFDYMKEDIWK